MTDTRTAYDAIQAVNWSTLVHLRRSPLHYRHACEHQRGDTPALRRGRLVHCAVLEPDMVPVRYAMAPEVDRRTKAGKEAYAAFCDLSAGKTVVTATEYDTALHIRDAVRSHPVAARYLERGQAETTLTWTHAGTGIACKGRPDWIGDGTIIDLKTARDISSRKMSMLLRDGYAGQLAFYSQGWAATHHGELLRPMIIAVESAAPHDVAVYDVTEAVTIALEDVDALMHKLATCRATDQWPGRHPLERTCEMAADYDDDGTPGDPGDDSDLDHYFGDGNEREVD